MHWISPYSLLNSRSMCVCVLVCVYVWTQEGSQQTRPRFGSTKGQTWSHDSQSPGAIKTRHQTTRWHDVPWWCEGSPLAGWEVKPEWPPGSPPPRGHSKRIPSSITVSTLQPCAAVEEKDPPSQVLCLTNNINTNHSWTNSSVYRPPESTKH